MANHSEATQRRGGVGHSKGMVQFGEAKAAQSKDKQRRGIAIQSDARATHSIM